MDVEKKHLIKNGVSNRILLPIKHRTFDLFWIEGSFSYFSVKEATANFQTDFAYENVKGVNNPKKRDPHERRIKMLSC